MFFIVTLGLIHKNHDIDAYVEVVFSLLFFHLKNKRGSVMALQKKTQVLKKAKINAVK